MPRHSPTATTNNCLASDPSPWGPAHWGPLAVGENLWPISSGHACMVPTTVGVGVACCDQSQPTSQSLPRCRSQSRCMRWSFPTTQTSFPSLLLPAAGARYGGEVVPLTGGLREVSTSQYDISAATSSISSGILQTGRQRENLSVARHEPKIAVSAPQLCNVPSQGCSEIP